MLSYHGAQRCRLPALQKYSDHEWLLSAYPQPLFMELLGVIWLCGVCPADCTRALIFYVLTIQIFTPAEQLLAQNDLLSAPLVPLSTTCPNSSLGHGLGQALK